MLVRFYLALFFFSFCCCQNDMPVDDYSKGVVFYLNKEMGKVVGVITWNLFGRMGLAKQVRCGNR